VKVFASEWIITIFSQIIPISIIHVFFERFFKDGWIAFYRLIIRMLSEMEADLISSEEYIYIVDKIKNSETFQSSHQNFNLSKAELFWEHTLASMDKVCGDID
jgi:hypothetical protein